jgi:hypothetical protein
LAQLLLLNERDEMRQSKLSQRSADKLDEAADDIEAYGLIAGRYGYPDGSKCMLGAINYVVFGSTYPSSGIFERFGRWAVYNNITETLTHMLPPTTAYNFPFGTIMGYSDAHDKDEVVGKLREAARVLREVDK